MNRARSYLKRKSISSEAKPQESSIKAFLQYSALPLTLGTALLYLLGWIYGTSYLSAWGLPIGLFPLTKDQSLITGFFHVLLLLANSMSLIAKITVLLLVVMIATMISCYKPVYTWLTHRVPLASKSLKGRIVVTSTHDSIMEKTAFLAGGVSWIIVGGLLAALLCSWADKEGKQRAARERTAIVSGQTRRVSLPERAVVYLKDDNRAFAIYSGHVIDNSATHAALYTGRSGMLILPMSQVVRIEVRDRY
ncbi:hypothetical protein GEO60473_07840 [Geobacter sp. 60473]|nr:hypothetical protein GEO60473_07840 [Geobacter sp. 60473]